LEFLVNPNSKEMMDEPAATVRDDTGLVAIGVRWTFNMAR
jgi:hypothetical protein